MNTRKRTRNRTTRIEAPDARGIKSFVVPELKTPSFGGLRAEVESNMIEACSNRCKIPRRWTKHIHLFYFPKNTRRQALRAVSAALRRGKFTAGGINLILLDDAKIKKLNSRFRNVRRKTDVISFRYSTAPLEGDIFLSRGVSKRQAAGQKHSWADELAYLAIHGILHLFGYTDYTPTARKRMFAVQDKIFGQIQMTKYK
ncbi:MAG: rRNA maturation RNase YbeY [Elusimicrobiota bacterium]